MSEMTLEVIEQELGELQGKLIPISDEKIEKLVKSIGRVRETMLGEEYLTGSPRISVMLLDTVSVKLHYKGEQEREVGRVLSRLTDIGASLNDWLEQRKLEIAFEAML